MIKPELKSTLATRNSPASTAEHRGRPETPQLHAHGDADDDRPTRDQRDPRPGQHAPLDDRADELRGDRVELAGPQFVESAPLGHEGVGDRPAGHRADLDDPPAEPPVDERHQRADGEQGGAMPAAGQGDRELAGLARLPCACCHPGHGDPERHLPWPDERCAMSAW